MPLNFGPTLDGDIKAVLLDADRVAHRVKELGAEISRDYVDKTPLLVGVLNGAMVFMADLIRQINVPMEICSLAVSSYGKRSTSGDLSFLKDVNQDVKGKHVIFVEDIVDTGKTTLGLACEFGTLCPFIFGAKSHLRPF
ncbi:hpt [Symbiodinium necroappetens]|uniref:Hpt protein n=1 Tax=Symbiodinium necroappetens TaxID=1628268 RepID=A0A813CLB2_9DINO|nr:hpt [Symbiodinium sp. KB8]CAE7944348.1 hpt [Symbiodinium necroappetens]